MMLEAMRREWEVYTLDTTDLFADKEGVYAHASPTTVADNPEHWFEKQPSQIMILSAFDVILMRKDPPFDMMFQI
jgi:glutathione synthase